MRVFVRNCRTGLYFANGGRWVGGRETCAQFTNPKSAIDCAAGAGLDDFELVLTHDMPRYEVVLSPGALSLPRN